MKFFNYISDFRLIDEGIVNVSSSKWVEKLDSIKTSKDQVSKISELIELLNSEYVICKTNSNISHDKV